MGEGLSCVRRKVEALCHCPLILALLVLLFLCYRFTDCSKCIGTYFFGFYLEQRQVHSHCVLT